MTSQQRADNFRHTSHEARISVIAWLVAFGWVISVSWWLGSERPVEVWFGIPKWVWLGPGIGWLCTVAFNSWFSVRMMGRTNSSASATLETRGRR